MLRRTSELMRCQLEARDGSIGRIKDVYFDDRSWTVRYLVADTGGWLLGRRVLLSPAAVQIDAESTGRIAVDLTRAQIENSPAASTDKPVSQQHQIDLHRYYGWTPYWAGGTFPITGLAPIAAPAAGRGDFAPGPEARDPAGIEEEGDPHLRSASEVTGYKIHARDDDLGHVEDLVVKTADWTIALLVVDTRNWWPGRKVAVPQPWISQVSWRERAVAVSLERERIKEGPEYPEGPLPSDFETRVAAHYQTLGMPHAARSE